MTHFSNTVTQVGPLLRVTIGVSHARAEALVRAEKPIPTPIIANLLIDTGASKSCICTNIASSLGLSPTGVMNVLTPSTGTTPQPVPTYDVAMTFQGLSPSDVNSLPTLSVTSNDFAAQGIDGLLGRDVLSYAHMFYNGRENMYFLSF
ncbi:aspartyl protease family protein [Neokomagataea anthophila]|uniref:Aspartyl protease family protein n=1 Tax=Neokomagataea anthophila TaxID=2826925 RepID=A0ABS5E809_9PROT|nr:aspartyl protease family protein [Neokomagataea anthophila]MBR0560043.1 aspartyl protease family protein [Neokomagataea anthophila]